MPHPTALWEEQAGSLRCLYFGQVDYPTALELQESLIETSRRGQDHLLLMEHPPVYTTGRYGDPANFSSLPEGITVIETKRGGDATYHGPGQLIGYPIVSLRRRKNDVHQYLRDVESALIELLAEYGIAGATSVGKTGVWVPDGNGASAAKIASIGIAVRYGVAWHGFALNVGADVSGFDRITACGLPDVRMTSIAEAGSGPPPAISDAARAAARAFGQRLGQPPTA